MQFNVGDIATLKKKHPCGSVDWEVLRVGADVRLRCKGCGREVLVKRSLFEKSVKKIESRS